MLCFNYWFLSSLDALEKALPQWVGALAWSRFPCFFPELGDTLGSPVLDGLTGASRTAMARWAGNAMHVAAVGSALLWIHTYGRPACSDFPREFAQCIGITPLPSPSLSSSPGGLPFSVLRLHRGHRNWGRLLGRVGPRHAWTCRAL